MEYPVAELFSRKQVQERTAIPDDVLGYWIKEGLLIPVPADDRKHRRFSYEQLNIAVVLNAMRSLGANVSVLRTFASAVQDGSKLAKESGLEYNQLRCAKWLARSLNQHRNGETVKVWTEEWLAAPTHIARNMESQRLAVDEADIERHWLELNENEGDLLPVLPFARSINAAQTSHLDWYLELIMPDTLDWRDPDLNWVWVAWLKPDGTPMIISGEDGNLNYGAGTPLAAFYISISRLIRPVWITPEQDAIDRAKADAWRLERYGTTER